MFPQDVPANDLIALAAKELKANGKFPKPAWLEGVKSSAGRERVPAQEDFWWIRVASILRTIYFDGPVGTERLRHKYGGRKRHVVHTPHHVKAGGKIIRSALQQLGEAGFVESVKGKGRKITRAGQSFLDNAAKKYSS